LPFSARIVANDLESDPVASGFVASVKRPGRNITGVFLDLPDFSKKWLEALREAVPHASEIGVLWDAAMGPTQRQAIETAASQLKVKLILVELKGGRAGIEPALEAAAKRQASAIVILSSPLVGGNTKLFADLTMKYGLPAVTRLTADVLHGAYAPVRSPPAPESSHETVPPVHHSCPRPTSCR
jgi:putative ABC transport system substrate-binding protein